MVAHRSTLTIIADLQTVPVDLCTSYRGPGSGLEPASLVKIIANSETIFFNQSLLIGAGLEDTCIKNADLYFRFQCSDSCLHLKLNDTVKNI